MKDDCGEKPSLEELLERSNKTISDSIDVIRYLESTLREIGEECDNELKNTTNTRADRGITLNRIKQIALQTIGEYNDEEYYGIY